MLSLWVASVLVIANQMSFYFTKDISKVIRMSFMIKIKSSTNFSILPRLS